MLLCSISICFLRCSSFSITLHVICGWNIKDNNVFHKSIEAVQLNIGLNKTVSLRFSQSAHSFCAGIFPEAPTLSLHKTFPSQVLTLTLWLRCSLWLPSLATGSWQLSVPSVRESPTSKQGNNHYEDEDVSIATDCTIISFVVVTEKVLTVKMKTL